MKTILIIEDNRPILENIAEILCLAGYNIIEAENGLIGIEIAKKQIPDLILCDVLMPEADGYTVLTELSKHPLTSEIPFIFLTSKVDVNDKFKGLHLGADDYLHKPFNENILLITIQNKLQKSDLTRSKVEQEHLAFINALESILFMTSHNVRGPLCRILGLINILAKSDITKAEELKKIMTYAEMSAADIDTFTKELTIYTHKALTEYKNKVKQNMEN
ncbi:MAG: response regulator [Bacteroidia bacterium]|jgi:response regulator RpfG family c-di-GMP phosphodiesterase